MPLIACPDCAREVSDAAPACPHCGRPFHAPPSAPSAAPTAAPKPIAGIVVACVLGMLTLVWALGPSAGAAAAKSETREMSNGVHALGCTLLLIGAGMSAAGHRWGNRVVRATAWLMLVLVTVLVLVVRSELADRALAEGRPPVPGFGWVVALVMAVGLFPWLLYLFLFRRSKYP